MAKGAELKGIKRKLFFWAVELGKKYDNNRSGGIWYNLQLSLANELIFNKWREALGNNIKVYYYRWCGMPGKTASNFQCRTYSGL